MRKSLRKMPLSLTVALGACISSDTTNSILSERMAATTFDATAVVFYNKNGSQCET